MAYVINKAVRNQWITDGPLRAYVRIGYHAIPNKGAVKTFDVGTVNIPDHQQRGKGVFKRWMDNVEYQIKTREELPKVVYVENVMNDKLAQFLMKRGYTTVLPQPGDPVAPSLFKDFESTSTQ